MGAIADQAAALKAIVGGVPGCGIVYAYQPLPANLTAEFVRSFTTTVTGYQSGKRHVRAWTIAYLGESREDRNVALGGTSKQRREIRWVIRGHMGWNDPASDPAFRDLVERVADELDRRQALSGTAYMHSPCSIDLRDGSPVPFGDALIHFAELSLTATVERNLDTTA